MRWMVAHDQPQRPMCGSCRQAIAPGARMARLSTGATRCEVCARAIGLDRVDETIYVDGFDLGAVTARLMARAAGKDA